MKNFIFKSEADFHKIVFNKLGTIQNEQIHARQDLGQIIRGLQLLINDQNLQKQVDEFFDDEPEHIPEVEKEPD